jgi:hypothetical protein
MSREELPVKVYYNMAGDEFTVQLLVDENTVKLHVGDSIIVVHRFYPNPDVHAYIERKEIDG